MTDGTYTGVVDRIVDGETAIVLLEYGGETIDQLDLDAGTLPAAGRHEGAVFDVTLDDGEPIELRYRPCDEKKRRESTQDRLDGLSRRLDDE